MAVWVPVIQPLKLNRNIKLPIRTFKLGQLCMSKHKVKK